MAVLLGLAASQVHALALGPIQVQSAIGEPLRAEVEVPNITSAEAENLRLNIASADAFQQAGIAYNQALVDVRATLQRRADGRYVVRLIGTRPLSDPFIDLLLEANWSAGRIVRDYTLLLDPPSSRATAAIAPPVPLAPLAPQVGSAPMAPALPRAATAVPPPAVTAARAPESPAVRPPAAAGDDRQVTVQRGDTAGEIARAHKAAGISLDQMLVALLRANPDAFIDGNVNRMRSGTVLKLPSAADAGTVPAPEASRTITAQSRDFGEYRRRLAENAPTSHVAEAGRGASGRLQANVEDRSAAAPKADRLTIAHSDASKSTEAAVLKAREAQDSQARMAELSRNIDDLNKLATGGSKGTPARAATATPTVGNTPPAAAAPVLAASPAARPGAGPQTVPAERDVIGIARDKSLLIAALGAALVLITVVAYRIRERRRSQHLGDSMFAEPHGGQPVASSITASPSAPAADDADPVAEADVYLAYGRDLQAEQILRDALRMTPERTALHLKLLEIHARRRDLRAYEVLADEVRQLTRHTGPDWERTVEMGRQLDPDNSLYAVGAAASGSPLATAAAASPKPAGAPAARAHGTGDEGPHAIKLALAHELYALGDAEGARSLAEEVAAESAGDLQAEAAQWLSRLR